MEKSRNESSLVPCKSFLFQRPNLNLPISNNCCWEPTYRTQSTVAQWPRNNQQRIKKSLLWQRSNWQKNNSDDEKYVTKVGRRRSLQLTMLPMHWEKCSLRNLNLYNFAWYLLQSKGLLIEHILVKIKILGTHYHP